MATLSVRGWMCEIAIVNASWGRPVPATISLRNFRAKRASGVRLFNDGRKRDGLVERDDEFVHTFEVAAPVGGVMKFEAPAHSALFVTLRR